ncbi:hypothetical protein HU200_053850 [Digitaria exilis]|uniref:Uncharacterized protein n=1 Tax=Digitaria exilis TaxID=1010633 RepID=A0A835ALY9_9POAL|nr:hypothetical protein HU200_053850 [Digitaria exilis]
MSRYLRWTKFSTLSGKMPSGWCSTNTLKLLSSCKHSVSSRALLKLDGGMPSTESVPCLHIIKLLRFFFNLLSVKLMQTLEILLALTYRWRTFLGIVTWKSSSIRKCSPLKTDSAISWSNS